MARTAEALSGAVLDDDTADTNVVVSIGSGGCTGTLITPQIVFTAGHCIYGAGTADSPCVPKSPGVIYIGKTPQKQVSAVDAQSITNACLLIPDGQSTDLGVLYLKAPITGSVFPDSAYAFVPRVVRPSLLGPLDAGFASDGGVFAVAGFGGSAPARRSVVIPVPAPSFPFGGAEYWRATPNGWNTEPGDSGGPLFYRHPNGRIDVLGALTGHSEDGDIIWPAVSGGTNRAWLLANVLESNVPVALRHTAPWLSRHGKTGSTWWGELDYSGPCQLDVDRDCDGWWDHGVAGGLVHDNCPYIANPDQLDGDEDGRGDVCELCPFGDSSNPSEGDDPDQDGVCTRSASASDLYKRDNCPTVKNANQRNCNEEAERVRRGNVASLETLGDACDPVPCPTTSAVVTGEYRNPVGGGHPQFGGFFSGRIISDAISTVRVAPHVKQPSGSTSVKASLSDVTTYARFCQQNESLEFKCHADANIRDSALDEGASSAGETAEMFWHRVRLTANAQNPDVGWHWAYDDSTTVPHTWSYAADSSYWTTRNIIPPPGALYAGVCSATAVVGAGTCLDGTLWYHADSSVGSATNGFANGVNVGLHGDGLANHYLDIRPDRAYAKTYSGTGLMRKFFFLIHTLPDPAPYETALRSRIRPLVGAATELDAPHVLEDHGGSWDASEMVTPNLAANLQFSAGMVWASAIEPAGVAANLDDRVQAMAISQYGDVVYDTVIYEDGMLKSGSDLTNDANSILHDGQPTPRTGFVSVLSRQAGGVFVIGGLDTSTGQELRDVHLWRPRVGWSTIVPSITFAKAKTATFSPADGQLWILEQRSRSYTLLRMSPWTGITQALGTWTRGTTWDQHFLAVDRDGQVLLVASSRTNQQSKFARIRVNTSGSAYASQIDADSIPYTTSGPVVDKDEYGVIVRDDTGAVTSVFRRANLLGGTGTFSLSGFFQ